MAIDRQSIDFLSKNFDPRLLLQAPVGDIPWLLGKDEVVVFNTLSQAKVLLPPCHREATKLRPQVRSTLTDPAVRRGNDVNPEKKQENKGNTIDQFSTDFVVPKRIRVAERKHSKTFPNFVRESSSASADSSSRRDDAVPKEEGQRGTAFAAPSLSVPTTVTQTPVATAANDKLQPSLSISGVGPLALLKSLFFKKCRVKVLIRRAAGVRGICTGFLRAFDKHFNMFMVDVNEEYSRFEWRRSSETRNTQCEHSISSGVLESAATTSGASGASTRESSSSSTTRRLVEARRTRHVNQLFIRGDNVVLVCEAA